MIAKSITSSIRNPYFLIFLLWSLATASKLLFHGQIYGLDFGLYHPDGTLYTFRTLTWLGNSEIDAANKISIWYRENASKMTVVDPSSLLFNVNPSWEIYSLRPLYPALSLPFVMLFGIPGMLVVPALSMLVLMVSTHLICLNFGHKWLGILLAGFFSFSLTINRWMYINTTDSLLVAITAGFVLLLIYFRGQTIFYLYAAGLTFFAGLVRFSLMQFLGISLLLFLLKKKKLSILIGLFTFLAFLPTLFVDFTPAVLAGASDIANSIPEKIFLFPYIAIKVLFFEISQLAVLDRYLLVFLIYTVYLSLKNISKESSKFLLIMLFSLWITGAINGVVGVNFRYQLPILPFTAWVIAENFQLRSKNSRKANV